MGVTRKVSTEATGVCMLYIPCGSIYLQYSLVNLKLQTFLYAVSLPESAFNTNYIAFNTNCSI